MIDGLVTYDQIVDYMNIFLENRYKELKENLRKLESEKKILGISSSEVKEKRQIVRAEMAEIFHIYSYYDAMLRKATTFERRHIVRLFTEYYTALYDKPFTSIRIKEAIVVASVSDLGDSTTLEDIDVKKLLEESQDTCIVFSNPDYTLLDGATLSNDFAPFKEIMPVIRNLVDLSIENPEMNDRLRMTTALESSINELKKSPKKLLKDIEEY